MWMLKGILIGLMLFAIFFAIYFRYLLGRFRSNTAISLNTVVALTIHRFWLAFVLTLSAACAYARLA